MGFPGTDPNLHLALCLRSNLHIDLTCALFLKNRECKDIKYNIIDWMTSKRTFKVFQGLSLFFKDFKNFQGLSRTSKDFQGLHVLSRITKALKHMNTKALEH